MREASDKEIKEARRLVSIVEVCAFNFIRSSNRDRTTELGNAVKDYEDFINDRNLDTHLIELTD